MCYRLPVSIAQDASRPSATGNPHHWLAALRHELGPDRVSLRSEDLDTYSRDLWPRWLLGIAGRQQQEEGPGAVVWPETPAEVQAILRICHEHRIAVVPYGAGSGVAGGAVGPSGSVVIDTKRMRGVEIDAERGVVSFGPGILGWHLEELLNRRDLTLGHFPSSIMCSTAGGWVATRGAGQMSTKYGKIEDLVRSVDLVTGPGELVHFDNGDSSSGGTDWAQLVTGSEGTLGVITRATCSVRRAPAARRLRGYSFPNVEAACRAIQHILQLGLRPAVVRLYDEIDTLISGMSRGKAPSHASTVSEPDLATRLLLNQAQSQPGSRGLDFDELLKFLRPDAQRLKGRVERWLIQTLLGDTEQLTRLINRLLERLSADSMLILGFEGEPDIAAAEDTYTRDQMARCGGRDLGEEPGQHWLRHRYNVSFKMPRAFAAGAFTDTIEVATTWDRLMPLYREVRAAVAPYALCMAHFSHAYPDGCSIYFTVVGRRKAGPGLSVDENRLAVAEDRQHYDALWSAAMQATLRIGATISHHHGVGRLKASYMPVEHGPSLRILSALRTACDPHGICNPGNLAPMAATPSSAPPPCPADPPRLGEPDTTNHLIEVAAAAPLFQVEQQLYRQRLSLGGLPPWSFARTVADALTAPRASEASIEAGRLRDRRVRLRATLEDGSELVVPPHVVPRRATGPELGQALLASAEPGQGPGVKLTSVTLRLSPRSLEPSWAGYLFPSARAAVDALFAARTLHGALGLAEVLLASSALLARVLGDTPLPPSDAFEWALIVRAPAAAPVATAVLKELEARIGGTASGRLHAAACRDFWSPDSLCGPAATADSVAAFAGRFPAHEHALALHDSSPAAVAALLAAERGPTLLCGVYLHGLTLCTDHPPTATAPDAASAQTILGPRLAAALSGRSA